MVVTAYRTVTFFDKSLTQDWEYSVFDDHHRFTGKNGMENYTIRWRSGTKECDTWKGNVRLASGKGNIEGITIANCNIEFVPVEMNATKFLIMDPPYAEYMTERDNQCLDNEEVDSERGMHSLLNGLCSCHSLPAETECYQRKVSCKVCSKQIPWEDLTPIGVCWGCASC